MHRIDGPGATVDNKFTDGDPVGGVQATLVTDDWLNDVQENVMAVLLAAGVSPTKGRAADLLDSISALIGLRTNGRLLGTPKTFFTAGAATYTRSAGMVFSVGFACGGGGGGGGTTATAAGQASIGSGGAGGSFSNFVITSAQAGASIALTIGSGGSAAAGANGGNGTATSVGSFLSCPGGLGGLAGGVLATTATAISLGGSPGGPPTSNTISIITGGNGIPGGNGILTPSGIVSGSGGGSPVAGGAGAGRQVSAPNPGVNASTPGGGGSGAAQLASGPALAGGVGLAGMTIIYEYGNPA